MSDRKLDAPHDEGKYLCNCGKVFPNGRTRDIHAGECPTCNPLKSEGPSLEANENGVGVMVNGRCLIFVASSLKNPAQHAQAYFQVAKDAYDEGRASLIPLVMELVEALKEKTAMVHCESCVSNYGSTCCDCGYDDELEYRDLLAKAEKELSE
jgi:hypothetical protein